MLWYASKVILSLVLIVSISELSKRSSVWGAVLASIPLVSVLAILWLWVDTSNAEKVCALCRDIFWLVLPSLPFFLLFPFLLQKRVNFYLSLGLSLGLVVGLYTASVALMTRWGTQN